MYELAFFRLRDHVQGADNNPLLIFPEGTCVNNHYTVMFKKVFYFLHLVAFENQNHLDYPTVLNCAVSVPFF